MRSEKILVGDIGGTKSILAIAVLNGDKIALLQEKTFQSTKYRNLEEIIAEYISVQGLLIDKACFAIAGPITNNVANVTNLPWEVQATKIRKKFKFKTIELINDLEAVAYAIPILGKDNIYTLHLGKPVYNGPIAVIAPGTGLGEAYLTYDNGQYFAHSSEGSHASFSPINKMQIELLQYLQNKGLDHVSCERVCSGAIGIPNIYNFAKAILKECEPEWFIEKLNNSEDITPLIIDTAQNKSDQSPTCRLTLDLFCEILAVEAGNLALKVLSTGGIYIAGGIPQKIIRELEKPTFINTLQDKGRFRELLEQIPVHIIKTPAVGLLGAARLILF